MHGGAVKKLEYLSGDITRHMTFRETLRNFTDRVEESCFMDLKVNIRSNYSFFIHICTYLAGK